MKTKEQIEELANEYLFEDYSKKYVVETNSEQICVLKGFKAGYTTCQEEEVKPLQEQFEKTFELSEIRRKQNDKLIIELELHLRELGRQISEKAEIFEDSPFNVKLNKQSILSTVEEYIKNLKP